MTGLIGEIFSKIFNDNVVLATIFVSMVPIMELKGGIPFGMSKAFWGAKALGRWQAFWWAYLGCSIVVVGLYFAFIPIMKLLRKTKIFKGLANYIDNRLKKQSQKYTESDNKTDTDSEVLSTETINNFKKNSSSLKRTLIKMFGVFCFVAIPLPLTGVWMGVCMAVIIGLNFWQTLVSALLGNLVAGIVISTICVIFPQFTHWLIYIFLILVAIIIVIEIIRNKIIKQKT
ncbi:MAG: COG2426 family protein, partial [Clostridia bacterium]